MTVRQMSAPMVRVVTTTKPNASANIDWTGASAPAGGYQLPATMLDPTTGVVIATSDTFRYRLFVTADNLWEEGTATLLSGGVTASRAAVVEGNSSGTTSRIDFSGASTFPTLINIDPASYSQTLYNLSRPQIYGLNLTYTSAVAFGAAAGCAFIEGVDGAPLAGSALADLTSQTGTAAHFYNVFEFLSSGVPTLEKIDAGVAGSTNAPVAFSVPAGSARSKTGDTSRRYLGPLLYGATNTIRPFRMTDMGGGIAEVLYLADAGAATPFLVLNAGAAASYATYQPLDFSALIPNNGTACEALLCVTPTSAIGVSCNMYLSVDGVGFTGAWSDPVSVATSAQSTGWFPINSDTTIATYLKIAGAGTSVTIYCWGFRVRR